VCESIAKETQKIIVKIEKGKFNKSFTVIQGIDTKEVNMKEVTKNLKNKFACGGTDKGGIILLQGDHKRKVKPLLVQMGFAPETIEVK
jgi:translation initiation factor 1